MAGFDLMEEPMTDVGDLTVQISERRRELDQTFFEDIRRLRQQHGDVAVDRALSMVQQQRDQVSVSAKPKGERGPQHFRVEKIERQTGE
jgi:hypothetical protein